MDPSIEIATLVVSYLWPLGDLFPSATRVSQLEAEDLIFDEASRDFALLARLRNIAHRGLHDQWPPPHGSLPAKDATQQLHTSGDNLESLDQLLSDIVEKRFQERYRPIGEQTVFVTRVQAPVRRFIDSLNETATDEDYSNLSRRVLPRFLAHVAALRQFFGAIELRSAAVPITREGLTDAIALDMLERQTLDHVALALEYRPILLRDLDAGPELLADPEYPREIVRRCDETQKAVPFSILLHRELDEIDQLRLRRRGDPPSKYHRTLSTRRASDHCLLGIALSGGGIRSATFSLGVLQGLASRGWLRHVDYLSTVSGGGYIGAWLVAWIKRRGSVVSVEESLRGHRSSNGPAAASPLHNPDPGAEHVRPIRLLREYSNYLAPQFSAFSADTWTMVSIWIRNTFLNVLVLLFFLMASLIAPRLLGIVFVGTDPNLAILCAAISLLTSAVFVGFNLRSFDEKIVTTETHPGIPGVTLRPSERGDSSLLVVASIVVPGLIAVFFALSALWGLASTNSTADQSKVLRYSFSLLFGGLALTAGFGQEVFVRSRVARRFKSSISDRFIENLWRLMRSLLSAAIASLICALLLAEVWTRVMPVLQGETRRGIWLTMALGPVVLVAIIALAIVLHIGLEGLAAFDERREWWSRLGAWLGLAAASWVVLASISYFAPYGVAVMGLYAGTLTLSWGVFTGVGAWLASGGKSNGINLPLDNNRIASWIITLAPFMFVLGFLIGVATLSHAVMIAIQNANVPHLDRGITSLTVLPFSLQRYADTYWAFVDPQSKDIAVLCIALLLAALALAWRIDINEFSMHHFYKNRLVRAYLGASRSRVHRRPNAFTGFDMDDDIKLWRFTSTDSSTPNDETSDCRAGFSGPYPIINATLNMTTGDELAWRDRKGQSFVFTPLYCGFDFASKQTAIAEKVTAQFGYRPTRYFAYERDGFLRRWASRSRGITPNAPAQPLRADSSLGIGTAIAISGAAANPNAGYHTSPAVAFLLTILNARLGWWIGNPSLDNSWTESSPPLGLFYLLSELFGFSGVQRKYINLSDGGHFDNMGLYELIRRRCRCIVLCDGEQDDRYSFNGLAGAIRKCRVDFGVVIDISTDFIRPAGRSKRSRCHVVVGDITYPEGGQKGTLIYLKASLTGDEPTDVQEYASRYKEFPHQTTADQFFDESQFESYRALGQHIIQKEFSDWPAPLAPDFCAELDQAISNIRKASQDCQDRSRKD